ASGIGQGRPSGRLRGILLVLFLILADAGVLLELLDTSAERAAKVAELTRAEEDHEDDQDDDELERPKLWHGGLPRHRQGYRYNEPRSKRCAEACGRTKG